MAICMRLGCTSVKIPEKEGNLQRRNIPIFCTVSPENLGGDAGQNTGKVLLKNAWEEKNHGTEFHIKGHIHQ